MIVLLKSRRYMHTLENYWKEKVRKTNFRTSQFFVLKNLIDVKIFVAIVLTFVNLCAFSLKAKNRIVDKLFQASFPSSVSRQNKRQQQQLQLKTASVLLKLLIYYNYFDTCIQRKITKVPSFLKLFYMIFAWHNLRVLSADFQVEPNYLTSAESNPKLCQLKILQHCFKNEWTFRE